MTAYVIADNGGGLTLQLTVGDTCIYQHTYMGYRGCAEQCAEDIRAYREIGPSVDVATEIAGWDGNEVEEAGQLEPTDEEIRNGGYWVIDVDDITEDFEDRGWANVADLVAALR